MAKTQLLRKLLSLPLGLALRKIGERALSKRVNWISLGITITSAVQRELIKKKKPWVDMLLDDDNLSL